jgi:hypothetical protein
MRRRAIGLVLAFVIGGTTGGAASRLALTIRDGRVWLAANDVPVTQILAEWGRVGQIRLVNGERIPGGAVSLQLDGVPEDQALKVLLRSASGFIAVPRPAVIADASPTLSRFESILILATAAAPAETPVRPVAPPIDVSPSPGVGAIAIGAGVQRRLGPDGQPVPDDQAGVAGGVPIRPQTPIFTPPGFAEPPQVAPAQPRPAPAVAPGSAPGTTPGVAVPGMVVPAPVPQPASPR